VIVSAILYIQDPRAGKFFPLHSGHQALLLTAKFQWHALFPLSTSPLLFFCQSTMLGFFFIKRLNTPPPSIILAVIH